MRRITTVVVGAGHAGLAMSRRLAERSIDHVVLERGEVANAWRTERWDSLRLLTPNWQRRLPGLGYEGDDPDGFATVPEVVALIDRYARAISAPVRTGTRVASLRPTDAGYLVRTDRGDWHARTVVIATGACAIPRVPALADTLPASVRTLTAAEYRNPDRLEQGGVLVVGASATGVQLADEIHRSGRPVTLAVGEHIRAPRTYRGRDIQWWMDAAGVLDQRYDEVDDIARARKVPSLQLVGSPERRTLDLNALADAGVGLVGRLVGVGDGRLRFSGLAAQPVRALGPQAGPAARHHRPLGDRSRPRRRGPGPAPPAPTRVDGPPRLELPLGKGGIGTIVWATGFRPDFSWLEVPVLDRKGEIRHDGGVVASPGLYVMGLPFLRRRKSALIDGAADDARDLGDHLASYLHGQALRSVA